MLGTVCRKKCLVLASVLFMTLRKNAGVNTWKEKVLHSQFARETEGYRNTKRWEWQWIRELKKETESLVCAAEEK